MVSDLILWALGVIIGGVITFLVSRRYYVKASNDLRKHYEQASEELRKEADELKKATRLVLRSLEEGTPVTLNKNEEGEIVGIQIEGAARIEGGSNTQATPDNTGDSD